jgi:hypothetical protein
MGNVATPDTSSDRTAAAAAGGPRLVLLLPAIDRLRGGLQAAPELAWVLARADAETCDPGSEPQLLRHFDVVPKRVPVAALTRKLDADDAMLGSWLRADPAWLRADMTSGRMMACGDMQLSAADADALLRPLRPLFGDEGFPISAPVPQRWYLSMPREAQLPPLSTPDEALGSDLQEHMPAGDAGRRWRRLLSESQVILHNHPLNQQRAAEGKPPVNSLWFWGWGVLPDKVAPRCSATFSDDEVVAGLCHFGGAASQPLKALLDVPTVSDALVDLRRLNDVAQLQSQWLPWALQQLDTGAVSNLEFDFADGRRFIYRRAHRWRFWRRASGLGT